jgi:hypothetical protein
MHGEFIAVWSASWQNIWSKLARMPAAPADIFCELYREVAQSLVHLPEPAILADRVNDPRKAMVAFRRIKACEMIGERGLIDFLERAFLVLEDSGGDATANKYVALLVAFINRFSLRYDVRLPCTICPTLPGMFASLLRGLQVMTSQDAHLDCLMKDFEDAIRDFRTDYSDSRIKTCIQKQMNLLEAIGQACPGVTRATLGAICEQVNTWPHERIKEAMKNLYGFASDYPGIRHGGTPANAIRAIEMRDMVAMSILLVGFTPYLTDQFNADLVYRGS